MTKNLQSDSLGDRKSPTLRPQEVTLRARVDQAEFLVAQASSAVKKIIGLRWAGGSRSGKRPNGADKLSSTSMAKFFLRRHRE